MKDFKAFLEEREKIIEEMASDKNDLFKLYNALEKKGSIKKSSPVFLKAKEVLKKAEKNEELKNEFINSAKENKDLTKDDDFKELALAVKILSSGRDNESKKKIADLFGIEDYTEVNKNKTISKIKKDINNYVKNQEKKEEDDPEADPEDELTFAKTGKKVKDIKKDDEDEEEDDEETTKSSNFEAKNKSVKSRINRAEKKATKRSMDDTNEESPTYYSKIAQEKLQDKVNELNNKADNIDDLNKKKAIKKYVVDLEKKANKYITNIEKQLTKYSDHSTFRSRLNAQIKSRENLRDLENLLTKYNYKTIAKELGSRLEIEANRVKETASNAKEKVKSAYNSATSKKAREILKRGGKIAGEAAVRGGKIAGEAAKRGSEIAGEAAKRGSEIAKEKASETFNKVKSNIKDGREKVILKYTPDEIDNYRNGSDKEKEEIYSNAIKAKKEERQNKKQEKKDKKEERRKAMKAAKEQKAQKAKEEEKPVNKELADTKEKDLSDKQLVTLKKKQPELKNDKAVVYNDDGTKTEIKQQVEKKPPLPNNLMVAKSVYNNVMNKATNNNATKLLPNNDSNNNATTASNADNTTNNNNLPAIRRASATNLDRNSNTERPQLPNRISPKEIAAYTKKKKKNNKNNIKALPAPQTKAVVPVRKIS